MILKGKYFLNFYRSFSLSSDISDFDEGLSANVAVPYTATFDYGTGVKVHRFSELRIANSYHSSGMFDIYYYFADADDIAIAGASMTAARWHHGTGVSYPFGNAVRFIDFGDTPVTCNVSTAYEKFFNTVFISVDNEFVSEPNLAQVTNKIMDKMVQEAFTKFESCKPTMSAALLNNTSGTTSLSATISDYDLLFIRANTYSNYTPLCYTIPAKLMCDAVGSSGSFAVQVADNSKYSNFTAKPSGITYSAGNSGKLYQVYGLKIPTEVK